MSSSRLIGSQLCRLAPRKFVYRPTVSANDAGIGGTPSTTRFSLGLMTSFCAKATAARKNRTTLERRNTFISKPPDNSKRRGTVRPGTNDQGLILELVDLCRHDEVALG